MYYLTKPTSICSRITYFVYFKLLQSYVQGGVQEISENTILQMIGRAGRPGFDTSGIAIILTKLGNVVSI